MKSIWSWIKRILIFMAMVASVGIVIIGLLLLIRIGQAYEWTGFGPSTRPIDPTQELVPSKTLWDWLGLLIIPIVLAVGGIWFSRAARRNEQRIAQQRIDENRRIAKERIEEERKIARERIEEERRIAEGNTQQTTLQAYLEQMSGLLLDKDLRHSEPESESRAIARAWTLTVLRRLDGDRKGLLLRFLYESDLILKDANVISLEGAHLEGAHLEGANLEGANLGGTHLVGAILRGAHLERAHLEGANLEGANLEGAHLGGTHLVGAILRGAHLVGAHLEGAHLEFANLEFANLKRANLVGANLMGTYLVGTYLGGTILRGAIYSSNTMSPKGFDLVAAGALLMEDEQKTEG